VSGIDAGHEQGGRHAFARHVADRDRDTSVGERDVVEEVAPDALSGLVEVEKLVTCEPGGIRWEENRAAPEWRIRGRGRSRAA